METDIIEFLLTLMEITKQIIQEDLHVLFPHTFKRSGNPDTVAMNSMCGLS